MRETRDVNYLLVFRLIFLLPWKINTINRQSLIRVSPNLPQPIFSAQVRHHIKDHATGQANLPSAPETYWELSLIMVL